MKGEGYDVTVAVDGQEGVEKIRSGGWDLVLVDENLPKILGLDVLKQAREIQPAPSKKFVFLTNSTQPVDKSDERIQLSDGYLVKSEYSPSDLVDKLKEFLS
jgi:two-component system chemotaxis response regulator CheY